MPVCEFTPHSQVQGGDAETPETSSFSYSDPSKPGDMHSETGLFILPV